MVNERSKRSRVGIYAGTFDPVHAGHIGFALQAMDHARLDYLYFLPERKPRYKVGAEHFGHRVAMLRRAILPHPNFGVLELHDVSFSIKATLPHLQKELPGAELVFLFGSDAIMTLPDWPHSERLLRDHELVVGLRDETKATDIEQMINLWPHQPKALTCFTSFAPDVSSGRVREALYSRRTERGLLTSVARYSNRNWLYVSVS